MQSIKKSYFIITFIVCAIGFIIPFFLKSTSDSWNTVVSASFTIVGSIITIAAIIITILLFDRYGVNAKFKQKQIDEVFELVQFLKTTPIHAKSSKLIHFVGVSYNFLEKIDKTGFYKNDYSKALLFSNDFCKYCECLFKFRSNEWLPKEIKNRLNFINIYGVIEVENPNKDTYIRMYNKEDAEIIWKRPIPQLTFEMFITNLIVLLKEIDFWLKKHSDIPIEQFS